ncbi:MULTISPECIES: site-specific integrase [Arthrobacter]|uniref:Site-specific integrase n=2 Tax=Arthrobacter TaxID=1663 RepID=A0ABU9KIX9_9MICC|nr:site-specific integrase [Arthrobacter sp. YJM1]MDP5226641.1 site-specific integrase [Arthrobacter sp. YJM1]
MQWRDDGGKSRESTHALKRDADKALRELTAAKVTTGHYLDDAAGSMAFKAWFERWTGSQVWADNTRTNADQALASVPFQDRPVNKIRTSDVQAWVKELTERLEPSTISTRHGTIKSCFKAAVTDRLIHANPCDGVKLPRVRRKAAAMTIPSPAQVKGALDAAPAWFAGFVSVCAFAGLRLGEAAGLQLADIDFKARTITVARQIQGETVKTLKDVPPKHGSERVIYIPKGLVKLLAKHVEEVGVFGDEKWLFGYGGHVLSRHGAGAEWRKIRDATGLGEFTLHDLRHYYASGPIAAGCDVVTVQRALGHATPSITLDVYSHLWPSAEDKTRAAAAGLLADVLAA